MRRIGLTWACPLRYFERNAREVRDVARRLIDLATEQDLLPWRAAGTIFDGWTPGMSEYPLRRYRDRIGQNIEMVHKDVVTKA